MKHLALGIILLAISPAVKAADGDSIDTAIRGLYDVISGPAGPRDWSGVVSYGTAGVVGSTANEVESNAVDMVR
jgi:hypothetical protein